MKRVLSVLTILAFFIVPLGLAQPRQAGAQTSTMTINTVERGSEEPVLHACYTVQDLDAGGGVGACDGDDGNADGTTIVTSGDPCSNCRVSQGLPDNPDTGLPTEHLVEPFQDGGFSTTYTFRNFLKPYLVVSARDSRTGNLVKGACIAVANLDKGGPAFGGCDGGPTDEDGQRNGTIETPRLTYADNYRVSQKSPPPAGYVLGPSVDVNAAPAQTGEFEAVTIELPPAPKIVIKTVASKTNKRLKGACYAISDKSHGGGLGTHCDGVKNGTFGDQDGRKNGVIVTNVLPVGHTYLIDQTKAPRGYRLVGPNKEVTTAAGKNSTATFKNRPKR